MTDETLEDKYKELGAMIGNMVDSKQAAYGNSFGRAGQVLRILYPDGVSPEQYDDMLAMARIVDKLFRIATQKEAFEENPYSDIVGYGLLGLLKDRELKEGGEPEPEAELKPCPFCGRNDVVSFWKGDYGFYNWTVVCDLQEGGCGAVAGYRQTREGAKEAWNERKVSA